MAPIRWPQARALQLAGTGPRSERGGPGRGARQVPEVAARGQPGSAPGRGEAPGKCSLSGATPFLGPSLSGTWCVCVCLTPRWGSERVHAVVPELGLSSCRCWNLGWGPFLSTVGARAGPGAQLPSWVCLPSLSFSLSSLPETLGCRRTVPGQRRGPLRRRALTPGFSPQPGAEGVPRAVPGVSPARGTGGRWGRGAGGADSRRRWGERARE